MDNKELEMAKEVARVYEEKKDYKSAYKQVVEQYKKALSQATTQGKEHNKTTNCIITDKEDIDNGDIYYIETGQTVREL